MTGEGFRKNLVDLTWIPLDWAEKERTMPRHRQERRSVAPKGEIERKRGRMVLIPGIGLSASRYTSRLPPLVTFLTTVYAR